MIALGHASSPSGLSTHAGEFMDTRGLTSSQLDPKSLATQVREGFPFRLLKLELFSGQVGPSTWKRRPS